MKNDKTIISKKPLKNFRNTQHRHRQLATYIPLNNFNK